MRRTLSVIGALALLPAIAAVASAGPNDAKLGRIAADGPVTLVSNLPGTALLHAEHIKPGDRVSGTITLSNTGDRPGALQLGVTGKRDRPGAYGGRLSRVLRLRVDDLSGHAPAYESTVERATIVPLGNLAGRETRNYRVTATFPDGGIPAGPFVGDNLQQGSSVEVALQWQLTTPDPEPIGPPAVQPASPVPVPPVTQPLPPTGTARPVLVRLRIPKQRVIRPRGLKLYATCEVTCSLRFKARIDSAPKGRRKPHTLLARHVLRKQRHVRRIRAGRTPRVFLKLTRRGMRKLKQRLHRRGRAGITVTARMRSKAGNRTARRRVVMRTNTRGERRR